MNTLEDFLEQAHNVDEHMEYVLTAYSENTFDVRLLCELKDFLEQAKSGNYGSIADSQVEALDSLIASVRLAGLSHISSYAKRQAFLSRGKKLQGINTTKMAFAMSLKENAKALMEVAIDLVSNLENEDFLTREEAERSMRMNFSS